MFSSAEELTAALLAQLDALQGHLRTTSAHDLAGALDDLQARVGELLSQDDGTLSAASEASLRAIAGATDRIEGVRERMVLDLAPPSGAEDALRRWTRSHPGDVRHRPESTHEA
ncbi:unannotated protein [freshwater metagenome]|uniref:Unannotated protein n=1 Tax=freshwater metagenome TaxID=449393 RepID=A0A6J7KG48_9ZZZZ